MTDTPDAPEPTSPAALYLVPLDSLPTFTREMSPARRALGVAMLDAIESGLHGTTIAEDDGAPRVYATEASAAAAAASAKRLIVKLGAVDASKVVRTRVITHPGDPTMFGWLVYLVDRPATAK